MVVVVVVVVVRLLLLVLLLVLLLDEERRARWSWCVMRPKGYSSRYLQYRTVTVMGKTVCRRAAASTAFGLAPSFPPFPANSSPPFIPGSSPFCPLFVAFSSPQLCSLSRSWRSRRLLHEPAAPRHAAPRQQQ